MPNRDGADDTALKLVPLIYDCALDPARWPEFIAAFHDAFGYGGATLVLQDYSAGRIAQTTVAFSGHEAPNMAAYDRHYSTVNPWTNAIARSKPGELLRGEDFVGERDLHAGEFFNDWLRPQGLKCAVGVKAADDSHRQMLLSVLHPAAAMSDRKRAERIITVLSPHLLRAAQLHRQFSALGQERRLRDTVLDALEIGVVLLDDRQKSLFANRAAEAIFRQADGLSLVQGRLAATETTERDTLNRLVFAALASGTDADFNAGGTARVSRPSGRKPFVVMVSPAPPSGGAAFGPRGRQVIVFISDPEKRSAMAAPLASLYRLTAAEIRLAEGLIEGETLETLSDRFRVSPNTLRAQLRSVFVKTDTSRQAELVSKLMKDVYTASLLRR